MWNSLKKDRRKHQSVVWRLIYQYIIKCYHPQFSFPLCFCPLTFPLTWALISSIYPVFPIFSFLSSFFLFLWLLAMHVFLHPTSTPYFSSFHRLLTCSPLCQPSPSSVNPSLMVCCPPTIYLSLTSTYYHP